MGIPIMVGGAISANRRGNAPDLAVRTHRLTKRYGQRVAVNQLDLEVRRGEIYGFLGPNGAGKTTTIRMLLGLIAPSSGTVEIFGRDVAASADTMLPQVGALVEMPAYYPYLAGRDNLRAAAGVFGPVNARQLDATLELVGLHARQRDRARTYSLGMKQRLGVGMALAHDPNLLVLDEPANGLDPAGIVEMRDLLRHLAAKGKTIFLSSHVLGEVQQICTRVAIIHQGRLLRVATVDELTRGQGEYRVVVAHANEALALVQAQSWGRAARIEPDGALVTSAPDGHAASLATFLVQSGFPPERLDDQAETLEQVFLRLTASSPASGTEGVS